MLVVKKFTRIRRGHRDGKPIKTIERDLRLSRSNRASRWRLRLVLLCVNFWNDSGLTGTEPNSAVTSGTWPVLSIRSHRQTVPKSSLDGESDLKPTPVTARNGPEVAPKHV